MASSKIQLIYFYIFTLLVITIPYIVSSHNITRILDSDPDSDFSEFNHYLTLTKLAKEINSRSTITVLAVSNSALSSLISRKNISISAIKNILSLHVLLDYYDEEKLHDMTGHVATATTLYQTTGVAEGKTGQVNITELKNGTIVFGSAQPGLKPGPKFVREIRSIPYNISVVEISAPIIVSSLLTSGPLDPAEAPAPEIEPPAQAPAPAPAPAPKSISKSPGPARAPVASPPAPPADEGGDDDGGEAESPDNSDDGNTKNNSGAKVNGTLCMGVLMSLVYWVIMFVM